MSGRLTLTRRDEGARLADAWIREIEDGEPDFNFRDFSMRFRQLPEWRSYTWTAPTVSDEAFGLFEDIARLDHEQPWLALKLMTIIAAIGACGIYPESFSGEVRRRLLARLEGEGIPVRERLEWAVACLRHANYGRGLFCKNDFFLPVISLMSQEAVLAPHYVLRLYDELQDGRRDDAYALNWASENPATFVGLARVLVSERPSMLGYGLMKLVWYARSGFAGYSMGEAELRAACDEAFMLAETAVSDLPDFRERMFVDLILNAFPDAPWYAGLPERLLAIEAEKHTDTAASLRNYLVVSINAPVGSAAAMAARDAYSCRLWMRWNSMLPCPESVGAFVRELLSMIDGALDGRHPRTRNRSFETPLNPGVVEDCIKMYWSIADSMKDVDDELYLYVLEAALEKQYGAVRETSGIGDQAMSLFTDGYREYVMREREKGARLLTYMVQRSGYSTINVHIRQALGVIYPMLAAVDSKRAQAAVEEGRRSPGLHMSLWQP